MIKIVLPAILIGLIALGLFAIYPRVYSQEIQYITEFTMPISGSNPWDITVGSDGNLWFSESGSSRIGKITVNGEITELSTPFFGNIGFITSGPDGNIWFSGGDSIVRMTPEGETTQFFLNRQTLNTAYDLTVGPDDNIWFTERTVFNDYKIGKITPNGEITEYPVGVQAAFAGADITAGSDGNLWFTLGASDKIGRITTDGLMTLFSLPDTGNEPLAITAGPDGNVWFTENAGNKIGKVTPSGNITRYSIPTNNSRPQAITTGPDGNIWFTEYGAGKLGRITPTGIITEFQTPINGNGPKSIVSGPDGNIWFTEGSANKVGKLNMALLPGSSPNPTPTAPPNASCILSNFGDSNGSPLRQEDSQWKNLPYGGNYYKKFDGSRVFLPFKYYGNNKDTIGAWGCKTTSAAMIVNYYAKLQNVIDSATGNVFQTDPKKLNEWLQQNNGYYSGKALPAGNPTYWDTAFLDLGAVVKYAKNNGVNLSKDQTLRPKNSENNSQFISRTKDALNNSMCALNPAILAVNSSGHFIDASGKAVDNAVETWQIHDPLWNGSSALPETLKVKYSNTYNQIDLMSGNLPKRRLTIVKYSPIEMYITDPDGNRAGLDPLTDTFYEEIPEASYGTEYLGASEGGGLIEAGMLDIVDPKEGDYTLRVIGTGNGEYGLEVREAGEDADFTSNKIFGTTETNQTSTYLITPSVNPEEPIVLQNKIEIKIIPDKVNQNKGTVGVILKGKPDFNVKDINISSVKLGEGAKPLLNKGFQVDINHDNKKDLLLFFKVNQAGVDPEDTQLCLTGSRKNEAFFKGCDEITITQQAQPILALFLNILRSIEPQELLKIRQFLDSIK